MIETAPEKFCITSINSRAYKWVSATCLKASPIDTDMVMAYSCCRWWNNWLRRVLQCFEVLHCCEAASANCSSHSRCSAGV